MPWKQAGLSYQVFGDDLTKLWAFWFALTWVSHEYYNQSRWIDWPYIDVGEFDDHLHDSSTQLDEANEIIDRTCNEVLDNYRQIERLDATGCCWHWCRGWRWTQSQGQIHKSDTSIHEHMHNKKVRVRRQTDDFNYFLALIWLLTGASFSLWCVNPLRDLKEYASFASTCRWLHYIPQRPHVLLKYDIVWLFNLFQFPS